MNMTIKVIKKCCVNKSKLRSLLICQTCIQFKTTFMLYIALFSMIRSTIQNNYKK